MKKLILALTLISVLITGCSQQVTNSYKHIDAPTLKKKLDKKEDILLVDVHIPEQQHIKGTDLFVPYNEIENNLAKFPKDKNEEIVLYCRGGSMSMEAAETLLKKGYTNVYNLDRGIADWLSNDYPLEN